MNEARCRFRHRAIFSLFSALALTGLPAAADEAAPPRFVMSVAPDTRGAQSVIEQDAQTTIGLLRGSSYHDAGPFDVANNLCVAHTLRRDFASARKHCERAVRLAREGQYYPLPARRNSKDTAAALSNRGVLRALSGELAEARKDLERAALLGRRNDAVEQNLRRLEQLERRSGATPGAV